MFVDIHHKECLVCYQSSGHCHQFFKFDSIWFFFIDILLTYVIFQNSCPPSGHGSVVCLWCEGKFLKKSLKHHRSSVLHREDPSAISCNLFSAGFWASAGQSLQSWAPGEEMEMDSHGLHLTALLLLLLHSFVRTWRTLEVSFHHWKNLSICPTWGCIPLIPAPPTASPLEWQFSYGFPTQLIYYGIIWPRNWA